MLGRGGFPVKYQSLYHFSETNTCGTFEDFVEFPVFQRLDGAYVRSD